MCGILASFNYFYFVLLPTSIGFNLTVLLLNFNIFQLMNLNFSACKPPDYQSKLRMTILRWCNEGQIASW